MSRRMSAEEEAGVRKIKRNLRPHHSRRPPREPAPPVPFFTPLGSDDRFESMSAMTIGFRAAIDVVDYFGLLPRYVEFLGGDYSPDLQIEAAWVLTNIACGTQTKLLIDLGTVPLFVKHLQSGTEELRKHALWALGNIAGDSPSCRDTVLDHGALSLLLPLLNPDVEVSILRVATWTLGNLCYGKPPRVNFERVRPALPLLRQLIQLNDKDILTEACWALAYLSDGPIQNIQAVVDLGVCPRLVEILKDVLDDDVIIPAMRTLGHIAAGGDDLTQVVIDSQALPLLYKLLKRSPNRLVLKEVCWAISNITAGNGAQKKACMEANLVVALVSHIHDADNFDIRREAAWAISNATTGADDEQIMKLVSQGCIQPLCDLLVCADQKVVGVCLEGLENILYVGENFKGANGYNPFVKIVEASKGLEYINFLVTCQTDETVENAGMSMALLQRFWE